MHLYLTGFMAVGKTTLGKRLAAALGLPFLDTDELIARNQGRSIGQIFAEDGEDAFRKMEADTLRSIKDHTPAVVATGGGLPCYYDNMAFMNGHGFTVYLSATEAFIYSRLAKAKKPRPLVKALTAAELQAFIADKLVVREPFYRQSAMVIKVPSRSPETLVNSIVSGYRQYEAG